MRVELTVPEVVRLGVDDKDTVEEGETVPLTVGVLELV